MINYKSQHAFAVDISSSRVQSVLVNWAFKRIKAEFYLHIGLNLIKSKSHVEKLQVSACFAVGISKLVGPHQMDYQMDKSLRSINWFNPLKKQVNC